MNEPSQKLLKDVAALAVKYKPDQWEALAVWLDDPARRDVIRQMLREFAAISREAPRPARTRARTKTRRPKGTQQVAVRAEIEALRREQPERADLLEEVWIKLRDRELLPTITSIRSFASLLGTKKITATRRDRAIDELMRVLLELNEDALEQRMREVAVEDRKLGEEYSDWVRLILGRSPGGGASDG
jgi:hypothetical protein